MNFYIAILFWLNGQSGTILIYARRELIQYANNSNGRLCHRVMMPQFWAFSVLKVRLHDIKDFSCVYIEFYRSLKVNNE